MNPYYAKLQASLSHDPHLQSVGFFVKRDSDNQGPYTDIRSPFKFEGSLLEVRREPPLIGQHSEEILLELGLNSEDVEALFTQGAVQGPRKPDKPIGNHTE